MENLGFDSRRVEEMFIVFGKSKQALRPTQLPIQWVRTEVLSLGTKGLGPLIYQSLLAPRLNLSKAVPLLLPYVCMDNFTFPISLVHVNVAV